MTTLGDFHIIRKEPKELKIMELTTTTQKFIVHWGEMGTRWGINRTVAQIHALLYISPKPLTAEEISDTLSIARSTVSTGLRELQSWSLVRVVHVLGDRRDHYETMNDVWQMFRVVLEERKRREVDPTLDILRETITNLESSSDDDPHAKKKLIEMYDFFETIVTLYEQVEELPMSSIIRIARMGDAFRKVLGLTSGD